MIFKNLCVFVIWMKVASALEGLRCLPWLQRTTAPFSVLGLCLFRFLSIRLKVLRNDLIFPGLEPILAVCNCIGVRVALSSRGPLPTKLLLLL